MNWKPFGYSLILVAMFTFSLFYEPTGTVPMFQTVGNWSRSARVIGGFIVPITLTGLGIGLITSRSRPAGPGRAAAGDDARPPR